MKAAKRFVRETITTVGGRPSHVRQVAALRAAPWGSPEQMDALRLDHLRETVRRAAGWSPFYRALLGPEPELPTSLADLSTFPVTSKNDMRASGLDRARPGTPFRRRTAWGTSGSSGEPYVFGLDLFYCARHEAQRAFLYLHEGVPAGARILELQPGTRRDIRPSFDYPTFRRSVIGYVGNPLGDAVWDLRPELLYGNRSHLLQVVDELEAAERELHVPFVCSSSETLHPADEARLAEAFGAKVFEVYGSAEAGNLAFRTTGASTWTIFEPRVIVEVLDDDRHPVPAGEVGEIVVTTLDEPTSPLIRYATGDLARVDVGSAGGRSGLRLTALEGRSSDALVDVAGQRISMWAIARAGFWANGTVAEHVRRWRVHQAADRSVHVSLELMPGGDLTAVAPMIEQHVARELGPVPVTVVASGRVHDPGLGKFRAVTSDATS